MSAIAGIVHLDGSPTCRELLVGMMDTLVHRGRDGASIWCGDVAGVAQSVTFITPESARDTGPLVDREADVVLVADGRIDNREELISVLRPDGGEQLSDCEIILAAYRRWGTTCAERLIGDFAFAVWNVGEQRLYCARDAMGVRPFYYVRTPRFFAFASELKALLQLPGVPSDLDDEQIALFLAWQQGDRTSTLYTAISRLPAAHTLVVTRDAVRRSCYWTVDSAPDVRYRSDDEYADAFGDLFRKSVGARLRATSPIAATLSGGLDSSAIVCEARRLLREGSAPCALHSFSLVFPDASAREAPLIDERRYAESVIRGGGLIPHYVAGDSISPLADLSRVLRHLDEPHFAPNLYLHWGLYAAAERAGSRVILDGFDGDVAVSHGMSRLHSLADRGQWDVFETEIRLFARHRGIDPGRVLPHFGFPYLAALARRRRVIAWMSAARQLARRFALSRTTLAVQQGLRPALAMTPKADPLWRPSVARVLASHTRARGGDVLVPERAVHEDGLSQPAYQLALEQSDKGAAAFGLEPRYPFFDRRLIEYCVGLPEELKFSGGWPRLTFRRAMEGVLPPDVQWRSTKANLSSNFHRRFLAADQSLVDRVDFDVLSRYVDVAELRRRQARYRTTDRHDDADGTLLFRSTMLATWLRQREERVGADHQSQRATIIAA